MTKPKIKDRLRRKTTSELSAIYVRITGVDLLRGCKAERVNTLYSLVTARKDWDAIINS